MPCAGMRTRCVVELNTQWRWWRNANRCSNIFIQQKKKTRATRRHRKVLEQPKTFERRENGNWSLWKMRKTFYILSRMLDHLTPRKSRWKCVWCLDPGRLWDIFREMCIGKKNILDVYIFAFSRYCLWSDEIHTRKFEKEFIRENI